MSNFFLHSEPVASFSIQWGITHREEIKQLWFTEESDTYPVKHSVRIIRDLAVAAARTVTGLVHSTKTAILPLVTRMRTENLGGLLVPAIQRHTTKYTLVMTGNR